MQKRAKITKQFEEEMKSNVLSVSNDLKKDVENYKSMKQEMEAVTKNTLKATEEIQKLIEISKNLKKEDFELTKFSKELSQGNSEKLKLMARIDNLERLIGKMRRGPRTQQSRPPQH